MLLFLGLAGLYPVFAQRANEVAPPPRFTSQAWGQTRHLEIKSLTRAMTPLFVDSLAPDHSRGDAIILFTFSEADLDQPEGFRNTVRGLQDLRTLEANDVRIAFAHEGWQNPWRLESVRNTAADGTVKRIWFLYYPLPRAVQQELLAQGAAVEYRFIVDGVWTADPVNPDRRLKKNGSLVSAVSLDQAQALPVLSPELISSGAAGPRTWQAAATAKDMERQALASKNKTKTVMLRYVAQAGREIYVQGSFNHFDPYMNRLVEKEPYPKNPGLWIYETELRLLPGQYYYVYYVDGQTVTDPLNKTLGTGPEGTLYSVFSVP